MSQTDKTQATEVIQNNGKLLSPKAYVLNQTRRRPPVLIFSASLYYEQIDKNSQLKSGSLWFLVGFEQFSLMFRLGLEAPVIRWHVRSLSFQVLDSGVKLRDLGLRWHLRFWNSNRHRRERFHHVTLPLRPR